MNDAGITEFIKEVLTPLNTRAFGSIEPKDTAIYKIEIETKLSTYFSELQKNEKDKKRDNLSIISRELREED
ncbi:MAG: hypothetical protein IKA07_05070 [Alistipes sp.]|nr:hypothetical protein [Alistipes sp.]